ncbi:MAG: dipeptidase [Gemmatimonadota bacterium]|nr:MAG: dipeptidase [Gemmatimonadota bacterium]
MTPERRAHVEGLHQQVPVIDCHNDSLQAVLFGDVRYNPLRHRPAVPRRLWQEGNSGHWDFPRARQAGQTGQVTNLLVPWVKDGPHVESILKSYRQLQVDLAAAPEMALLATTAAEIEQAHAEGKVAVILGIEGAEGIAGDLDLLHVYHHLGVRSVGLTWMYRNEVAEGNWEDTGAGLSPFGRQAVQEMNQLKMLVDVAHSTEQTFWDTLETSSSPVICSHTSCRALVKDFHSHAPSRYFSDEQLKALAEKGGVIGIFFTANRELDDDDADVHDLARFIAHAADVAGAEHVGLGSDLDGGFPPHGLEDIRGLPNLTGALIDAGFSDEELLGILGGNWLRVFRKVWGG